MRAARSLVEVFGEESVYRMGGDEYLVFDKKISEEEMNQKIEKLREVLKTNDVSMSLGALYLENAELPIDELRPFKNHPFRLYTEERMAEMVESVQEHGIISPILVRPAPDEEKKRYYEQGAVDRRGRR